MNDSMSAIEVRQLSKRYGKTEALAPLDLTVPRGAIFALVGHNGAGKTTLIKLLLNILKPTGGEATVLGEPAAGMGGDSFRRIGYVSENQEMPEWMTVQGLMDYMRPFYATSSGGTWEDAGLLADLDLPPDRKLKHLSRGMKMKAALASVLAFRPPLIVMDEPFSGLDPLVRDELIGTLLDRIAQSSEGEGLGTTVLISSHDLAEIESFATHVAFLHKGKLLFAETMGALTARFREVTVTLAEPVAAVRTLKLPAAWLVPEAAGTVFRFVHSHAEAESIEDEVRAVFPQATDIQAEPMTLRTIFLALVKRSPAHDAKQDSKNDRSRA